MPLFPHIHNNRTFLRFALCVTAGAVVSGVRHGRPAFYRLDGRWTRHPNAADFQLCNSVQHASITIIHGPSGPGKRVLGRSLGHRVPFMWLH